MISSINEVYFGKKPVSQAYVYLNKFRLKWVGKNWEPKINYDPDLLNFNREIEAQFGYKRFALTIDPSLDLNAYMFNVGLLSSDNGKIASENLTIYKKSSSGFKYTEEAGVIAIGTCYMGLISNKIITTEGIMAVLLHEIGHSFTYVVLDKDGDFASATFLTNLLSKGTSILSDMVASKESISNNFITAIISKIMTPVRMFDNISNAIKFKSVSNNNKVRHTIQDTVNGMRKNMKYYDYTNEKFADTFASMYGYGEELQATLDTMVNYTYKYYGVYTDKKKGKISIAINVGMLMLSNSIGFMFNTLDEHPEGLTRIKTQIDYIEHELKNESLDPLMKKELQAQLEKQRKLIDDFIDCSKDETNFVIIRQYYAKLYKKYGGDIREKKMDNDAMFDTIDNRYNDLKESNLFNDNLLI